MIKRYGDSVSPCSTPIWKSDLTDKMKRSFFQAAVVSILLYGCTTWTLTKRLEKKLDSNYTRMLRAILNKSRRKHPTKYQLYGHLPPTTKTIQFRRTRHVGHCWRSSDELISDVLLWTPSYGRAKAGRPARTYIQQLCEDTGCGPEDMPEAMNDREKWRERVRDIRAGGTTWWWWWYNLPKELISATMMLYRRHESNDLLSWWWHWFLWEYHSSLVRTLTLFLFVICKITFVNRSKERKWFHTIKDKKHTVSRRNYNWSRLRRWSSTYCKYTCSSWASATLPV